MDKSIQSITALYQAMRPLFLRDFAPAASSGSAAGAGLEVHALSGPWHTGQIDESQAPWAATKNEWATAIANHAALPAAHHAPVSAGALISVVGQQVGIALGNQQYQVPVTGASPFAPSWTNLSSFAGAGLAFSSGQFSVGVANTGAAGLSVEADVVRLTSSSNPGAAARILASDSSGYLSLVRLTLSDRLYASLIQTASGDLTLSPAGARVIPIGTIQKDLGDYNRKWRTLYAGELYVETLVAQNVIATIGGRVMVAPTSKLIAELLPGATTIDVAHNIFAANDYLYLAAAPGGVAQVEVLKIVSGPTTITGGYRYTVTRNVDGSGANRWEAGDAVVLLREGYIDLTATSTALNHMGPTIVTYARTNTATWNGFAPTTAQGNLRSFVDYSSNIYGFALGNNLTLTPTTGFKGMAVDPVNGMRLFNTSITQYDGATPVISLDQATGLDIRAYSVGGVPADARRKVRWMNSLGGAEVASIFANTLSTGDGLYIFLSRSGVDNHTISLEVTRDIYNQARFIMNSRYLSKSLIKMTADNLEFEGTAKFSGSSFDVFSPGPWISGALRIGGIDYASGSIAWHAGNDGHNSGLDADMLDGIQASSFARWDVGPRTFMNKTDIAVSSSNTQDRLGVLTTGSLSSATNGDFLIIWHLKDNEMAIGAGDNGGWRTIVMQPNGGTVDVRGYLLANKVGYDWTAITPASGWANYGSGNPNLSIKRFGNLIAIKGNVKATTNKASNSILCTLPAEYRPSELRPIGCLAYMIGASKIIQVNIQSNGEIRPQAAFSANEWVSLEIMYFV